MPLITDPSFTPPAPPETVESSDGRLTVSSDPEWAGARLKVSFAVDPPVVDGNGELPEQVRFVRGDGQIVRGGDPALSPEGIALGYDHEAPLGATSSWTAVPIFRDGTEGTPSASVALALPTPVDVDDVWLKAALSPSLSVRVLLVDPPTFSRKGRVSRSPVVGRRVAAASYDLHEGVDSTLRVLTTTSEERVALEALLDAGPVLFQTSPDRDVDDLWLLIGDADWAFAGDASDPARVWTLSVTEVDRPATLDSPFMDPGRSWALVEDEYTSWDELEAQVPTYLALNGW